MTADPRALAELLEESQDLQADALRPTHEALDELVESAHAQREDDPAANQAFHETHTGALHVEPGRCRASRVRPAVRCSSAPWLPPRRRAAPSDVQILQTAASIENLAVSTYKTALTLPYIGGSSANPVVTKFAQVTMGQHAQHADAFNAAVKSLGGKAQTKPDPAFVPVVKKAVAGLGSATAAQGALGVVALALELENIAAETYVKDTVLAKKETEQGPLRQHHGHRGAARGGPAGGAGPPDGRRAATDFAVARHRRHAPGRRRQRRLPQRVLQDQQRRPGRTRSRQVSKNKTKNLRGHRAASSQAQTAELDELHHDVGMPAMAEALGDMRGDQPPTFLAGCRRRRGRRRRARPSGAVHCPRWPRLDPPLVVRQGVRLPAGRTQRRPGGGRGGRQLGEPGRLRLHRRPDRGDRGQARHGASGGGHVRHDGQGAAPAACASVERGAEVERQGAGHGDQPDPDANGSVRLRQGDRHHRAWPSWP